MCPGCSTTTLMPARPRVSDILFIAPAFLALSCKRLLCHVEFVSLIMGQDQAKAVTGGIASNCQQKQVKHLGSRGFHPLCSTTHNVL